MVLHAENLGVLCYPPVFHTLRPPTPPFIMSPLVVTRPLELERGERQLWFGEPPRGLILRGSDVYLIPLSLLCAGFAVFWETSVLRENAPAFFALWGIPFVLLGVYITIGRFFADAWRRSRTSYALTTERVIIRTGASIKSLSLRTLADVTLTERPDGRGTITFGPTPYLSTMYAGMRWPGRAQPPMFELIPDARQVDAQIRKAQQMTGGVP